MKRIFTMCISLLPMLMFIACQKEEQMIDVAEEFIATMEPCTDQQGKTSLVGNHLRWEKDDEVVIYGRSDYGVFSAAPQLDASNAVFHGMVEIGAAPYYAVYPSANAFGQNSVTLPAIQWEKDGFIRGFPMYTQSDSRTLAFRNLCGLLKLHLTKPNVSISSITFIAEENVAIRGCFAVDYNNGSPLLTASAANSNKVKLCCATAQNISTGADFYLYLPAGEYQNFTIEIRTNDGMICTKSSHAPKTLQIERSKYSLVTLGGNDLTFVNDAFTQAELVSGPTFRSNIPSSATAVVFEYNSPVSSGILLSTSDSPYPIYGNLDGTVWRITTSAHTINANPNCSEMFKSNSTRNGWTSESPITLIDFGTGFNTSNVTDMSYMFSWCSNVTSLDVSLFNTENVTDMSWMFERCFSLTSLDVSNFNTSRVTSMHCMFIECYTLKSLDVSHFNTSNVTDMCAVFEGCTRLTSLDISNFNTANVTDMSDMFGRCMALTELDLSNFNTSNVTDMSFMFMYCFELESLDISSFNTENVWRMNQMFDGCRSLTSLDLSHFNTSNVDLMQGMFMACSSLESLDVSHFNTSRVTQMAGMFQNCYSLTSLDLSSFNTSNVSNMAFLFYYCTNLTNLDISGFSMNRVSNRVCMCEGLSTTSGMCTITCTEAMQNTLENGSYLPTEGVTFTWVRPTSK